jgi:hypothetical protein
MRCNIYHFSKFSFSKGFSPLLLLGALLIRIVLIYLEISQKPKLEKVTSSFIKCKSFEALDSMGKV